jgi:hypothetical protein
MGRRHVIGLLFKHKSKQVTIVSLIFTIHNDGE